MSEFSLAIPTVFEHEGFYSNDPNDRGGPTQYGISLQLLKALADEDGDGFLDGDINHDGIVNIDDIRLIDMSTAGDLYQSLFWDRYRLGELASQVIATKSLDLCVNMGPRRFTRTLQRAIAYEKPVIKIDGIIGSKTRALANACDTSHLFTELRHEAAATYRALNRPKYIRGWLRRAYS